MCSVPGFQDALHRAAFPPASTGPTSSPEKASPAHVPQAQAAREFCENVVRVIGEITIRAVLMLTEEEARRLADLFGLPHKPLAGTGEELKREGCTCRINDPWIYCPRCGRRNAP